MMYSEFLDRVDTDTGDHVSEELYHRYVEPVYNFCNCNKAEFCQKFVMAYDRHYVKVMSNLRSHLLYNAETETAFEIIRRNCEQCFFKTFLELPENMGIAMSPEWYEVRYTFIDAKEAV